MKLLYTTRDGRMTVELEGDTQADLWRQLARFQEVFEDTVCTNGKLSSNQVNFVVRTVDDNEYFELVCVDETKPTLRYAKKLFGQHKKPAGSLFPKSDGWVKYNKETKQEEPLKP